MPGAQHASPARRLPGLYVQVLIAVALGVLLGVLRPAWGVAVQPLGEAFVKLIKVMIAPIVFCTVAVGIAKMQDLKRASRVGVKALLWFEVSTTLALCIGLLVAHLARPGAGIHAVLGKLDSSALDKKLAGPVPHGFWEHLLGVIPDSFLGPFARGEILQVLVLALLTGVALARLGSRATPLVDWLEHGAQLAFSVVELVMRLAPIGAFGAMACTIGKYGVGTLGSLLKLIGTFYVTSLLFIGLVLGVALRLAGLSIWRLLVYLREELLIVLGTSSSESVLPRLMDKLERAGCKSEVVRLVVPTGYSFNLDGTAIYLTLASLFIAQALDIQLPLGDELGLLAILLLTSKGAAAVTGGGFVTLAATLSATHTLPVLGLTLLLGVDRFMSEARALTNLVGNAAATLLVARWEGALDLDVARAAFAAGPPARPRPEPGS